MDRIKENKNILIVSQYFWPENFRVNELVLALKKRGYTIEVLTTIPNYPSGRVFPEYSSDPSKYNDYYGIKVHRVWQITRFNNKLTLMLNYLSFVLTASLYSLIKLRRKKFDMIFGIQLSPIFSMIPAILLKKILRKPLYFWVLDIWPDSIYGAGIKSSFVHNVLRRLCVRIYSSADILFLSSNGFKTKLKKMRVLSPELIYLPNWIESDYEDSIPLGSPEDKKISEIMSAWKNKVIFTFTGNIGEAQDFPTLLRALKKCANIKNIVILLIGEGRYKSELVKKIKDQNLENVVICLDQYPSKYMSLFYNYSSYLFLSLKDTPVFSYTLPGKIQSYMSSGKPIVGIVNGESAKVIDEANCGFTVPSGNCDELALIIDKCCFLDGKEKQKLGNNGLNYANEFFKLDSILDKVLKHF